MFELTDTAVRTVLVDQALDFMEPGEFKRCVYTKLPEPYPYILK